MNPLKQVMIMKCYFVSIIINLKWYADTFDQLIFEVLAIDDNSNIVVWDIREGQMVFRFSATFQVSPDLRYKLTKIGEDHSCKTG
jgi:hypothetical protein